MSCSKSLIGTILNMVLILLPLNACSSLRGVAVNQFGDALAKSGTTFSADDDPELIGQALPFGLKLMESLLSEAPRHRGLLLATASGFTAYSNLWVAQPADELREIDYEAASHQLDRARRLYLRARDYGLRGLETRYAGITEQLQSDPASAVARVRREDVPYLVWTATPWVLAISLSLDQPAMVAELPIIEALFYRAYQLDPEFGSGLLHSLLLTYEASRPMAGASGSARAREHFRQAVALSDGAMASPYVSLAESVVLSEGNRGEFEQLLHAALAVDVQARPEWRLQNVVAQRRARWLLDRVEDLFPDAAAEEEEQPEPSAVPADPSSSSSDSENPTTPPGKERQS